MTPQTIISIISAVVAVVALSMTLKENIETDASTITMMKIDIESLKKNNIQVNQVLAGIINSEKDLSKLTSISCETFKSSSSSNASETASVSVAVPNGYFMTGGGCKSSTIHRKVIENYPESNNQWHCATRDHTYGTAGAATAYVVGCKVVK